MGKTKLIESVLQALKKSHRKPSKFIELINCIRDLNQEGKTASYKTVIRKLWPDEWENADDKVKFENSKWNLLRKRRIEINERVLNSTVCFDFFIELTQEKQFKLLYNSDEIYNNRIRELELQLAREKSQAKKEHIKASIIEFNDKFRDLEKRAIWKSVDTNTHSLPAAPTIAILPFINMSNDPEQEYFSDGITEEIITALTNIPSIKVIARNSSFTYKGKSVNVQEAGEELGVQYLLEGSVRKNEKKVRITAQLVETGTGNHIWAERYDRNLDDIFSLQDEITMKIIIELQVKLTEGERSRLWARGTDNIETYLKYLKAVSYSTSSPKNISRARKIAAEIISIEPDYTAAYVTLALTYLLDQSEESSETSVEKAIHVVQKALSLDPDNPEALEVLGNAYQLQGRFDKSLEVLKRCIMLNPNFGMAHSRIGRVLIMMGKPEEALPHLKAGLNLNPSKAESYGALGTAYQWLERYDEAIAVHEKAMSINPKAVISHFHLAACYAGAGNIEKARDSAATILELNPEFSIDKMLKNRIYKDPAYKDRFKKLLIKAGLPE